MPQVNPKISIYWLVLVLFGGISMLPLVMSDKYGYISPGKVYLRALRNDPFFDDATRILIHCAICVAVAAVVALFGYREEPPLRFNIGMLLLWIGLLAAILAFLRSRGASWELYVCLVFCIGGRIIAATPRWLVHTTSTPASAIEDQRR